LPQVNERIAVVLKGYPRLSETFIAQEILELQGAGFDLEIVSLRHPTDKSLHPVHREIRAPVSYLPEYLHDEPLRVLKAWRKARRLPGYSKAFSAFLRDLRRDFTRNRVRRFGQALVIAAEIAPRAAFLYAHFIHTPTSAARYAAIMAGLPFAISAHAKDIWTSPGWELSEKLGECQWCVTCTGGGLAELRAHAPDPGRVHLVYHGLDLDRFPQPCGRPLRDGSDPADPLRLLTVGRAVAKKGIDTALAAFALLPPEIQWRWTHIGGGPLKDALKRQAESLGIASRCEFLGARPQEEVLAAYRQADLFVLPCRIDETGDRDGLPNVLVEAQSQGVAVVSTPVSGVPELVRDGVNGLLVPPDDSRALAAAIAALGGDPVRRNALGAAGEARVRGEFGHDAAIRPLFALLRGSLDALRPAGAGAGEGR
jgi:glycosyltransferase involved in cell wall biosynthesis